MTALDENITEPQKSSAETNHPDGSIDLPDVCPECGREYARAVQIEERHRDGGLYWVFDHTENLMRSDTCKTEIERDDPSWYPPTGAVDQPKINEESFPEWVKRNHELLEAHANSDSPHRKQAESILSLYDESIDYESLTKENVAGPDDSTTVVGATEGVDEALEKLIEKHNQTNWDAVPGVDAAEARAWVSRLSIAKDRFQDDLG